MHNMQDGVRALAEESTEDGETVREAIYLVAYEDEEGNLKQVSGACYPAPRAVRSGMLDDAKEKLS